MPRHAVAPSPAGRPGVFRAAAVSARSLGDSPECGERPQRLGWAFECLRVRHCCFQRSQLTIETFWEKIWEFSSDLKISCSFIVTFPARQAVARARSEVRTAEGAVAALGEVCDSLRADEADLRARLHQLHLSAAAAGEVAAAATAGRDAACQVCGPPACRGLGASRGVQRLFASASDSAGTPIKCWDVAQLDLGCSVQPRTVRCRYVAGDVLHCRLRCFGFPCHFREDSPSRWVPVPVPPAQALEAVQARAEAAGQAAERWGDQASRLRAECSLLEASLRDQRLDAEREVRGFPVEKLKVGLPAGTSGPIQRPGGPSSLPKELLAGGLVSKTRTWLGVGTPGALAAGRRRGGGRRAGA